jgi:hypothetical protein
VSDAEIPDNAWDTEVRRRTFGGEDEETVRAEVIARYLDVCDPRPLVSAILKKRVLSASTMRRVAAVFDKNGPVPTIVGITFGKGRPPTITPPSEEKIIRGLTAGVALLAEGCNPDIRVWRALALGLRCGHLEHWIGSPPESPFRLRLQFRELNHRPKDPALDERNRAVLWFVDKAVEDGLTKSAAIECVARDLGLEARTVKRVYYRE